MSVEIAFDLDGIIFSARELLARSYREFFGKEPAIKQIKYHISDMFTISEEESKLLFNYAFSIEKIPETKIYKNCKQILNKYFKNKPLIIITKRPFEHKEPLEKFLKERLDLDYVKVFCVWDVPTSSGKADILRKLKVKRFIEDYPETCELLNYIDIKCYLMLKPWNISFSKYLNPELIVKNWNHLDIILQNIFKDGYNA